MSLQEFGFNAAQLLGALITLVVVSWLIKWRRSKADNADSFLIPNAPKDTVILHQYGEKALTVPSISPFVMKLETYLRVTKIPYQNQYSRKPGPRGKLPWIQYNDLVVSDSQNCIEFLNVQHDVNLNQTLKPDQMAIGHLIRRSVEESTYNTLLMWRLVYETTGLIYRKLGVPAVLIWYMRREAQHRLWSHGIARYTKAEVTQIMEDDLRAVSQLLGDGQFLFGDSVSDVTEFDCALFGQLCHLVWQMPGCPVEDIIAQKYPNLVRFCENMKAAFWPDWDTRVMYPSGSTASTSPVAEANSDTKTTRLAASGVPDSNGDTVKPKNETSQLNVVKPFNGKSPASIYTVHQVHGDNQVVTPRSTAKVSASALLKDQSTILPAP